jgi:hypothetical protein
LGLFNPCWPPHWPPHLLLPPCFLVCKVDFVADQAILGITAFGPTGEVTLPRHHLFLGAPPAHLPFCVSLYEMSSIYMCHSLQMCVCVCARVCMCVCVAPPGALQWASSKNSCWSCTKLSASACQAVPKCRAG